ncbi:hypothetical protein J5N97_009442 [Dioscorea zingiberensis]|uniref:CCHC-type domain-containing protein n=1 Tax=Dioscorea zingiberensis TaxID=325984 RepID=A0A9D5CY80_9LILI|nr:hypothetical protein J5N97_009442 [Dioscorea zingiberensis]
MDGAGIHASPHPRRTAASNSPRRDGVTFADVVWGEGSESFIAEALTTPVSPAPQQPSSDDERGWEDVHFKRHRRQRSEENKKHASPPLGARQGSPPYIRTPAGLVEVCGKCLKPGHMAAGCRRAVTCRTCGGVGHKAREYRRRGNTSQQARNMEEIRPRAHYTHSEHRREQPRREETTTKQNQPRRPEPAEKRRQTPDMHPTQQRKHDRDGMLMKQSTNLAYKKTNSEKVTVPKRKITHLHASLALDGDMVAGKEEMETFTVATITKIKEGYVTAKKLSEALKIALEGNWEWPVKEFREGRLMITCKSPMEAREIEKSGELHFPAFSIKCEPWSADIWKVGPADGEIRRLEIRRLPTFCWNRNSAGKVLKGVGDLLYVDRRGGYHVDDTRALVRVRGGRTMPCILWTNLGSRKYKILVGVERGQEPLPWNNGELGEISEDMEAEHEESSKTDKGKQPSQAARKHTPSQGKSGKKTVEKPETSLAGELRKEGRNVRTGPASTQDRSVDLRPAVGRTPTVAEEQARPANHSLAVPRTTAHEGHVSQPHRPAKEKRLDHGSNSHAESGLALHEHADAAGLGPHGHAGVTEPQMQIQISKKQKMSDPDPTINRAPLLFAPRSAQEAPDQTVLIEGNAPTAQAHRRAGKEPAVDPEPAAQSLMESFLGPT